MRGRQVTCIASSGATLLLVFGLMWMGCGGSDVMAPETRQPFLYLILNQVVERSGDRQVAFVLTMVRPDSVVYREADSFEMRRVSDGAEFAWREERLVISDGLYGNTPRKIADGNWLLADSATGEGLGYPSLEPGDTYALRVVTGDRTITGRATIPDTFSVRVIDRKGDSLVVWPKVDGAAGYAVQSPQDGRILATFQTDTTYRLEPGQSYVQVWAVGPQAYHYATNDTVRRAGIEGGLGVFGAVQGAEWQKPRDR